MSTQRWQYGLLVIDNNQCMKKNLYAGFTRSKPQSFYSALDYVGASGMERAEATAAFNRGELWNKSKHYTRS